MNIETYSPSESLKPYIKNYLVIESGEVLINRVLPDTSLVIAFRFKGQINYIDGNGMDVLPPSVISGLRKSVRLINYAKDTASFIIVFKETGAAAFFREPLHELWEDSVPLDNFIALQKISIIEEQLAEAMNNRQRVSLIETFLLARLYHPGADKFVSNALMAIHSSNGNVNIKNLADKLYISQDAFEKRFRKAIGASPKQLASIIRMRSVITTKLPLLRLSDIAYDAGYYDQPHFNRDFKLFTGQTPTDFFKSSSFW